MMTIDILFSQYFIPVFLMSSTPFIVYWLWFINVNVNEYGYEPNLYDFNTGFTHWIEHFFGTEKSIECIGYFTLFQLFIMWCIPGKDYYGIITSTNNRPVYKDNGLLCYLVTMYTYILLSCGFNLFSPTIIYDNFGDILASLNVIGLVFCVLLYIKGILFPSSSDNGTTGNILFDFYCGVELHPSIAGVNIKQFTNCRFGMMSWALIILSFAYKQQELYGLSDSMVVSVLLQLIYITKFFMWETGYFNSIDIMYDRAGYMICWGCLVWVPGFYTLSTLYLVNHPIHLGCMNSLCILSIGAGSIIMNYYADIQRQIVRQTNGKCLVFGKPPVLIEAEYTTVNTRGEETHKSLLLCSGYWGIARHFHYIPELMGAFCWAVPALFTSIVPYFYFMFLLVLLLNRAIRDDIKCQKKYGKYWNEYCKKVPYKVIPFIY
jgi:7-dehydrocholesterol reductase